MFMIDYNPGHARGMAVTIEIPDHPSVEIYIPGQLRLHAVFIFRPHLGHVSLQVLHLFFLYHLEQHVDFSHC
jgi:hypothetical protein